MGWPVPLGSLWSGWKLTQVSDPPQRASCWLGHTGWRHESGFSCRPHGMLTLIITVFSRESYSFTTHARRECATHPCWQELQYTCAGIIKGVKRQWFNSFLKIFDFLTCTKYMFIFFPFSHRVTSENIPPSIKRVKELTVYSIRRLMACRDQNRWLSLIQHSKV